MSPDQELPNHAQAGALRARGAGQHGSAMFWRAAPAATAALVVVVVAILAITLTGGGQSEPTLDQIAALSGRGPAGPVPGALTPASHTLLTAAIGDLRFPNWESHGGWHTTGEQTDTLEGRAIATTFYSNGHTQLTYSIVAAPALPGSRSSQDRYAVLQQGDQVTVVWIVHNHTCVLSANGFTPERLWKLAATTLG